MEGSGHQKASVQPLRTLRLCGKHPVIFHHRKDAKVAEEAQRRFLAR